MQSNNESLQSESESSEESGFDHIAVKQTPNTDITKQSSPKYESNRPSFKFNIELPHAMPISDQHYSLEPDMIFGWVPRLKFNGPISLSFKSLVNDQISDYLLYNDEYPLLYLGFRPCDTIKLHKQYSSLTTYQFKFETPPENQKVSYLIPLVTKQKEDLYRPFIGMNKKYLSTIQFDSQFEGGNLDLVVKVNDYEYDLFMRVDSNTRGHLSWFNFKISQLPPKYNIRLNICNFTKGKCLYSKGMRPFISINDGEWIQSGKNITYKEHVLRYKWVDYSRKYYCLSFDLESRAINDSFQVAYCVPYTYTKMLQMVKDLCVQPWCQQLKLCQDLSGINIPLLVVTDPDESIIPINLRKVMIIQARIHPGESNGSWMMHGFLKYLESEGAQLLKSSCVIKIIPMVNPDGVILGNYRTGSAGRDQNREFIQADQVLYPSVHAIKQLVADTYAKYGTNLMAFVDMHGHSVKKNVFTYGPDFSIQDPNYLKCRMLTKLLDSSTEMFRYYSSIFRVSEHKKSTARGVFCQLHEIVNCFTVEASNGFYYSAEQKKTHELKAEDWTQMGYIIGQSLSQLVSYTLQMELIQIQRMQLRQLGKSSQSGIHKKSRRQSTQIKTRQTKQRLQSKMLNQLHSEDPNSFSIQDQVQLEHMENDFEGTTLKSLLNDIQNLEHPNHLNQKRQNQLSDDDSEGRSDSESSQDDDNELVVQLRKQILKQTLPNSPNTRNRQRRQSGTQKNLISQRLRKPTIIHPHVLLEIHKPDAKLQYPMSFGMAGGKRPLPTLPINLTERLRSQEGRRGSKIYQKPQFQIITKSMINGITSQTAQLTQDPIHNFPINLTESFAPCTPQIENESSELRRPSTALPDFVVQENTNVCVTQRTKSRFQSQPVFGQTGQTSIIKNNAVIYNKVINQFQEEKNSILEQQGFIQFMIQKHKQINPDGGYQSTQSSNICSPLENGIINTVLEQIEREPLNQKKQNYQPKLFPMDERFKLEIDKNFRSAKQSYPSAFYSMKKHLFKKNKPSIYDLQTPMIVKASPNKFTKK